MDSVQWIVVHNPPRPTIFATIQTDNWTLTAETTEVRFKLDVIQHSLLILTCVAAYPVFWFRADDDETPLQTRTYNPYLPFNSTFGADMKNYNNSVRDPNEISAIERYEANLTMINFSAAMEGVYYCQLEHGFELEESLKSSVNLTVKYEPDTSTHAEVIQAGFDSSRPQIAHLYRYWNTKLPIPFIYGIPQNASVTYALFTIDPDKEWDLPQPQMDSESTILKILDFIEVEQKLLSPQLGQAIITITRGSYFHRGDFYFILRTNSSNGSAPIETRQKFHVVLDTVYYKVAEAEQLTPFDASTLLTSKKFCQIRLYFLNPDWINPRLVVYEQQHKKDGCDRKVVPPDRSYDVCGLMSFSLFDEQLPNITQKGVQLFLFIKKPCVFTVLFDANQGTDVVSPSLYTAVLDLEIFQDDQSGVKMIAEPQPTDELAYTNENISLRCLLPKCRLFYTSWSINNTWTMTHEDNSTSNSWPPCKYGSCHIAPVPNVEDYYGSVTFSEINELTASIDMHFLPLKLDHSGHYACAVVASSARQQHMEMPLPGKINLQVKDPIPPVFSDGQNFATFNQSFKEGTSLPLLCKVDGLPKPEITWSWQIDGNDDYEHQQDFNDNSTFQVYKPGTYVCNATSKYGWNSRTYNVQYDKPESNSYIPFAIAIPVAMAVFAVAAFLVWWIRRRAIQAAFKELAKTLQATTEATPLDDSTFLNDQVQFLQYNRTLEIDRSRFTMTTKLLGIGEFGSIYKGELKINEDGDVREVAIKVPRDSLNLLQFRSLADELKIMSHIRSHVNVLALVGACTQEIEKRQLFVLTEFCENGSLKDYLAINFMKFEGFEVNLHGQFLGAPGAVEALLKYGYQAANGMSYLAAERIIHRDVALRNLLLTGNHIVKISDFGMSRQNATSTVYQKRLSPDIPVPVFWMALESLCDGYYTGTSDVWSFGVVLWEMFSCGKRPYPNHEPDAAFLKWLTQNEEHRMGPPNIACDEIYQLMLSCWKSDPEARPSFSECKRFIARILEQRSPSAYQMMEINLSDAWLTMHPNKGGKISNASGSAMTVGYRLSSVCESKILKEESGEEAAETPTEKNMAQKMEYNSMEAIKFEAPLDMDQGSAQGSTLSMKEYTTVMNANVAYNVVHVIQ